MEEYLRNIFSESLPQIPLFCQEEILRIKLVDINARHENILAMQEYERQQREEKIKLENLKTLGNENTASSAAEVVKIDIEEVKDTENDLLTRPKIFKYHLEDNYDRAIMK